MLKQLWITVMATALLTLVGCAGVSETSSDGPTNENADTENQEHNMENHDGEQTSDEMIDTFAEPPTTFNDQASNSLKVESTKNVTRLNTSDLINGAIQVSQTVWPATHQASQPGTITLVPDNNWQVSMASANFIHHPNNGPILFMEKEKIPRETMAEIERLKPNGNEQGTEILVAGEASDKVLKQLKDYQVKQLPGEDPAEFAAAVDAAYAEVAGELPKSVIIVSSEEEAKLYSLPAVNWIAHMSEPVLYVLKDEIPEATKQALKKRTNELNIYLLGPESVISPTVEEALNEFGNVTRINGSDPVTNAVAFAKFKDEETGFGWGLEQPGHNLSFISTDTPDLAVASAPFAHLGKHAPLIWLDSGEISKPIYDFLALIRPTFTESPQEGPYNHGFMIGTVESIPFKTQGIIDEKFEITNASGSGHGGH